MVTIAARRALREQAAGITPRTVSHEV